jgi:hypothetical protein
VSTKLSSNLSSNSSFIFSPNLKLGPDRRHDIGIASAVRELQMLTNDYRMSREKLLKSEALMTLALKVNFEAHSAATLQRKSGIEGSSFGVAALCAEAPVPQTRLNGPSRDLTARCIGRADRGCCDVQL